MNLTEYTSKNYNSLSINNDVIELVIDKLKKYIEYKIPIILCANGGSAYTVSHFAQDLSKVCGAITISLPERIGLVLAISNDISFEEIFRLQLKTLKFTTGLLIGISCSGNSKNVINAFDYAKSINMPTISFTGNVNGSWLADMSDININIPTDNIFVCESIHSMITHYIIDRLREMK